MNNIKLGKLALSIKYGLSIGSLALVPAHFAHAEEANGSSQMETITVTAQALKVETPAQETPKSVAIVSESEIKEKHVLKLDEAFRYTAGYTSPYGPDNDAEWMFVRGLEPSVYLDGNRLYKEGFWAYTCLLYTSPSPRDRTRSRMPSSA